MSKTLKKLNEASDQHNYFMNWATSNQQFMEDIWSADEVQRLFNQHLQINNLDKSGNPLSPTLNPSERKL